MPSKKIVVKVPKLEEPAKAVISNQFPPRVMTLAGQTGKIPLSYWFEEDHKVLAIQWTDFSKDRYPAE